MTNPLHAAFYADAACQRRVTISQNAPLARDTYRVRFVCPEIASAILPGQFVMLRVADCDDPLLGRPLALYDTHSDAAGTPQSIELVYLVKGKFTQRLARAQPGEKLEVWGPLGNGFPPPSREHVVMVAGGIGQTPFVALGKEYLGRQYYGTPARRGPQARRVTLCYGARTADLLAGVPDFERAGIDVRVATDDGSAGHHGLVSELLATVLAESDSEVEIVCCGPEPMMAAVAHLAQSADVPCLVSLETPMACGIGICFTCVARIRDHDGTWDYKRTCVEGPVFDAGCIQW